MLFPAFRRRRCKKKKPGGVAAFGHEAEGRGLRREAKAALGWSSQSLNQSIDRSIGWFIGPSVSLPLVDGKLWARVCRSRVRASNFSHFVPATRTPFLIERRIEMK